MLVQNSVFQLVVDNVKLDIVPTFAAAMNRHLQLVFNSPHDGARAKFEHKAFLKDVNREYCDPDFFAIRYVLATVKRRRDIVEHRLSEDPNAPSELSVIPVDTGFDPSFELLLSSYWVKTGLAVFKDERERVRGLGRAFGRMKGTQAADATISDLLDAERRNRGLPLFVEDNTNPRQTLEVLEDLMVQWLERLCA